MLLFLQNVLAPNAHLAKGQHLREEPTVNKRLSKFRVGKRMPTVSNKEQQHLYPFISIININIKSASMRRLIVHNACKFT
jgi:hypothetical protein